MARSHDAARGAVVCRAKCGMATAGGPIVQRSAPRRIASQRRKEKIVKLALVVMFVLLCAGTTPAIAHSWYPLGWSGPIDGGGTTNDHPENLCQRFSSYACIVAGTQTFGIPLQKWRIDVWNSGGLNTSYYTNDKDTKGWIVVIGAIGQLWQFTPVPGTYNGIFCSMFNPASASGVASLPWGSSSTRRYYQAVFNGSYGGSLCVAP